MPSPSLPHRSIPPRSASKILALPLLLAAALAMPLDARAEGSRQLATGGASQIEGSAGGGLVPWAVIAGYGAREEIGVTAFATRANTGDYRLDVHGAAVGLFNRLELSVARQSLDLITLGPALGLPGASLDQDIIGAKLRLGGDVLYSRWPQWALGVQYKRQRSFTIPGVVGARDDSDYDLYTSATKVWLAGAGGYNLVGNATLRWSRANETGLLGFGGDRGNGRQLTAEASLAVLLERHWAVGAEFRQKRGHLSALPEDHWRNVFVGWFPNRHLSIVLAYVDLGTVATLDSQTGWYLSLTGGF
ncbi:DUF3034 family protein [Lysobacter sp. CAU 1642]|uniref:DUF3034 family protein n=1 Tax=Pseudomarimonas salicorniae TaxID=2933270 RepID=A0ABT0GMK1_9GAMM|nr:DUF3034 family protein [Lysobacter sp. CAU 1642]MCK7595230.1 DUF3034 family protein [Lysobacter sp. CAU 1642]